MTTAGLAWLGASVLSVYGVCNASFGSDLAAFATRLSATDVGLSRSNRGGWHSRGLEAEPALAELRRLLEEPVLSFLAGSPPEVPSLRPPLRVHISALWANIHSAGDANVPHRHAQLGAEGEDMASKIGQDSGPGVAGGGRSGHSWRRRATENWDLAKIPSWDVAVATTWWRWAVHVGRLCQAEQWR